MRGHMGRDTPACKKGTVGASGMLNPKGEAFAGLIAFKTTEKCTWAEPSSRVLGAGGCQSVPLRAGTGAGDEGPDSLIPSGLKCKEKEQRLSWEAQESLEGAGSVLWLGSAPGTRSSSLRSACLAVSAPARGINHLDLDTLEIQLLLHASHRK